MPCMVWLGVTQQFRMNTLPVPDRPRCLDSSTASRLGVCLMYQDTGPTSYRFVFK
jgi:hypothetical protein